MNDLSWSKAKVEWSKARVEWSTSVTSLSGPRRAELDNVRISTRYAADGVDATQH